MTLRGRQERQTTRPSGAVMQGLVLPQAEQVPTGGGEQFQHRSGLSPVARRVIRLYLPHLLQVRRGHAKWLWQLRQIGPPGPFDLGAARLE